jgi:hypothetical protein
MLTLLDKERMMKVIVSIYRKKLNNQSQISLDLRLIQELIEAVSQLDHHEKG